jgi:CTD kinase subunit beta
MHDTLKKPHELQMASYAIRFPDRVAKVKSHGGDVEIVDPAVSAYFTFVPGILNTE